MSDGLEVIAEAHFVERTQYGIGYCSCSRRTGQWVLWSPAHLADAIRAAGWRKAPQEACTAICGDGGGAGEELGLRERVEALANHWERHARLFVSPVDLCTREDWEHVSRALRAALADTNRGCGDRTCDEEHGDEHDDMTTAATEEK